VVAQLIHALSRRSDQKYLPVSVAALPRASSSRSCSATRGRIHRRHSGSRRLLRGGRLRNSVPRRDRELALEQQTKLLRILQSRSYSRVGETSLRETQARLVTATNRDLAKAVQEGRFREDLYYRIASYCILLPPLRERGNDIELLARYFAHSMRRSSAVRSTASRPRRWTFSGATRSRKRPGAGGIISAAVLLEQTSRIQASSCRGAVGGHSGRRLAGTREVPDDPQDPRRVRRHQTRAAEKLGIARQTLNYLLKKYREQGWMR